MENIFYDATVSVNALLQTYIPVSRALSDEQILPSLSTAFAMYVAPMIGKDVAQQMVAIAAKQKEFRKKVEAQGLDMVRLATANLAFYHHFTELNVHITDQGFQRQEGESFKPLFRYQELELKQQFKNKGFNALDLLLDFLAANENVFQGFITSPAYNDIRHSIVHGASEIEMYHSINKSAIVHLMLKPYFRLMYDSFVLPSIGSKVDEFVQAYVRGDYGLDSEEAEKGEKLRERIAAVVILKSLARFVRNVGSVTDRGLYYEKLNASGAVVDETSPANREDRKRKADEFDRIAEVYLHYLVREIKLILPQLYEGDPCDALNRDNDHHQTFWA